MVYDKIYRRMTMAFIDAFEIGSKLAEAGLIPEKVRRIVIDINIDSAVTIYYETFASKETVDLIIEELIKRKNNLCIKKIE